MTYALLAQEGIPAPAPAGKPADIPFFANPMFLLLMMGLFFLVVMLPAQRRQRREQQNMMANIKRGTRVVTSGGVIGTVVTVKENEDELTLRSEDTRIKVLKSSVIRVLGQDENESK